MRLQAISMSRNWLLLKAVAFKNLGLGNSKNTVRFLLVQRLRQWNAL